MFPATQTRGGADPVHKTLTSAANLANLLPTGTVLAFQALTPSFSNDGSCRLSNRYLMGSLITSCALICFLSSFTDSFTGADGKLYCGIATLEGLYVFNSTDSWDEEEYKETKARTAKYKIRFIDFVHAFASLVVFLIFAASDPDVLVCFMPKGGANEGQLIMNLPLAAGVLSSLLFMIFPTTRRGIGYADMVHMHTHIT